jgi:FMN-dependent NADH-azoreductase
MKILYIDCCISQRGEASRTARLCGAFLEALEKSRGIQTEHLDLKDLRLDPFTVPMLNVRDALFQAGAFGDETYALARQFRDADGIIVGAPFWDLSFPAQLRIYLEHVSANGITYYYDEHGPHGNCRARWLVYLTSGGDFAHADSLGVEYWRQLCGMFGIEQYRSVFAGGLDADPAQADRLLNDACQKASLLAGELTRE